MKCAFLELKKSVSTPAHGFPFLCALGLLAAYFVFFKTGSHVA